MAAFIRKQSSTDHPLTFWMFLTTGDPATGKTVSVSLSKDGGAFAAAAGAVSEVGSGCYKLAANTTDRDTLGSLALIATAAGCQDTRLMGEIVAGDPYAEVAGQATLARKLTGNKWSIDNANGVKTIYDDDGSTPLVEYDITSNADGSVATETPRT